MDTASLPANSPTHSFQPPVKTLDFRFHGQGFEYFRIWSVNILLTILTLGIYSAWAKVRNKQYFYGNTELDGASFTYDAQPIKILKGRMIALGFIALLSFISTVNPFLGILVPLAFIPMTPFFIQRSLMFNARYSSYRNVRFGFSGSIKDAMKVFAGWPFVMFAGMALIVVVLGTLGLPEGVLSGLGFIFYMLVLVPFMFYKFKHYVIANSLYGIAQFAFRARLADFVVVFLQTFGMALLILFVTMLGAQLLGSSVFGNLDVLLQGDISPDEMGMLMLPLLLVFMVAGLFIAVLPYAFYVSWMNNLVFNKSSLADFEFRANFSTLSYARLHCVNMVLTVLTLGLFIPFAKVRIARYKAEHTQVLARSSLDQFVARQEQEVGALGEAVGDFYDLDFGI